MLPKSYRHERLRIKLVGVKLLPSWPLAFRVRAQLPKDLLVLRFAQVFISLWFVSWQEIAALNRWKNVILAQLNSTFWSTSWPLASSQ